MFSRVDHTLGIQKFNDIALEKEKRQNGIPHSWPRKRHFKDEEMGTEKLRNLTNICSQ